MTDRRSLGDIVRGEWYNGDGATICCASHGTAALYYRVEWVDADWIVEAEATGRHALICVDCTDPDPTVALQTLIDDWGDVIERVCGTVHPGELEET